jgi:hypothetical protein
MGPEAREWFAGLCAYQLGLIRQLEGLIETGLASAAGFVELFR